MTYTSYKLLKITEEKRHISIYLYFWIVDKLYLANFNSLSLVKILQFSKEKEMLGT